MNSDLKIGELANRTSCPVETIRYYEREGLLPAPARSEGNFRLYDEEHVARLSFRRRCRSLDMALDEIRALLRFRDSPDEICQGVNELLDHHIGHVAARIVELKRLEEQLRSLRGQCGESRHSRDCGILNEIAHACSGPDQLDTRNTHLTGIHRLTRQQGKMEPKDQPPEGNGPSDRKHRNHG